MPRRKPQAAIGFGWDRDGFVGTTEQVNTPKETWAEFFMENRLDFQIRLLNMRRFYIDHLMDMYKKAENTEASANVTSERNACTFIVNSTF